MSAAPDASRFLDEMHSALERSSLGPAEQAQLRDFGRAVLRSVDSRDLRDVTGDAFLARLQAMHKVCATRDNGEIVIHFDHDLEPESVTVLLCVDDQPFLVSAVRALLRNADLEARRIINAVVRLRRDRQGHLAEVGSGTLESIMEVVIARSKLPEDFEERLRQRLALARAMVGDFGPMKTAIATVADSLARAVPQVDLERAQELHETEALLRWLCAENFVLFSVELYSDTCELERVLGAAKVLGPRRDEEVLAKVVAGQGRMVRYRRSEEESPVHRAGKPGYFVVPTMDGQGRNTGVCVIAGLFTYKALHTPPEDIPLVRLALRDLLRDRGVSVDSHRGKSMTNAFNSVPLEYLASQPRDGVWELTDRILRAELEGGSDLHLRVDESGAFAFVFVALPRNQFSEELRLELQRIVLEALGGTYADYGVYLDRYDNAVIHYYVTGAGPLRQGDQQALRDRVMSLARSWPQRLREALELVVGEEASPAELETLTDVYVNAFSDEHMRRASRDRLAGDLRCLEALRHGADLDCDLFVSTLGDHPGTLNLRTYFVTPRTLSRQLPVIGNFGFEVIDEYNRTIDVAHFGEVELDNFRLDVRAERIGSVLSRRDAIVAAISDVFAGRVGDDILNRLVVSADLSAHEVEILRSYVAYLVQLGVPFTVAALRTSLNDHPYVATALMQWLRSRFDPTYASESARGNEDTQLKTALAQVSDYTADRALRAIASAVRATERTNAFILAVGERAMAFKIASERLEYGPEPKPFREIWVYDREIEGVHLRAGRVARGGLRFSDRRDDFRTEIHGLMATQRVKNVLIVPMGAKGGFILRDPPRDRGALRAAGDAAYEKFITALLSITDNVVEGTAVTPQGVLHTEGEDPYLVVAADKGTAHLSDTANGISQRHGFWLDDAFASGGSNGYDHKATGITARGAWEVSRRCFFDLGIDPEADVITGVGIGDMSGDVFGNGLLRSKTVKLLGAFNHRHIFVDPDPDPAASYEERLRLFNTPGTQWTDYGREVMSEGGGVYDRMAKDVPLSKEARTMLGLSEDEAVNGEQVIRALLRLDVDFIWAGGIGTYVKASTESNADVGDKANDAVRVNASELRCRVFCEGANLAITVAARVEYANNGGQGVADFVDNSGGVDASDHEVNIKILFAPLLAQGKVARARRNELLREAEDEVVEMVLDNNRAQGRMVAYDAVRSARDLHRYERAQRFLAEAAPFDERMFALPNRSELARRRREGLGLHRYEAGVLCAHAKMWAYSELLADEPMPAELAQFMVDLYFPKGIAEAAGNDAVAGHLLHREIATTMVVNRIVDNAGSTFFPELAEGTGRSVRDVVEAYMYASRTVEGLVLQEALYKNEGPRTQSAVYYGMALMQDALERATYALLETGLEWIDDASVKHTHELLAEVGTTLPAAALARAQRRIDALAGDGLDETLASTLAYLEFLTPILDAVRLCANTDRDPKRALAQRLQAAAELGWLELEDRLGELPIGSSWDAPALRHLRRRIEVCLGALVHTLEDRPYDNLVDALELEAERRLVGRMLEGEPGLSALVVLAGQLEAHPAKPHLAE